MKTTRLLILALLVIMAGCSKENDTKNNTDPCAGKVCLNGGHCADGTCVCPQGFTGADCSQEITPKKMTITKIEITRFPATDNNGGGWDNGSGPDIYPAVYIYQGAKLWSANTYYTNAQQGYSYPFTPSQPIVIDNPDNTKIQIDVNDYDDWSNDDWMGGIYFTPYLEVKGKKFPSVFSLDAGGSVAFNIYVTYTW